MTRRQAETSTAILVSMAAVFFATLMHGWVAHPKPVQPAILLGGEVGFYVVISLLWARADGQWARAVLYLVVMALCRGVFSVAAGGLDMLVDKSIKFVPAFKTAYLGHLPGAVIQILLTPLAIHSLLRPAAEEEGVAAPAVLAAPKARLAVPGRPAMVSEEAPPEEEQPLIRPDDARASTFDGLLAIAAEGKLGQRGLVAGPEGLPLASTMPDVQAKEEAAACAAEMWHGLRGWAERIGIGPVNQILLEGANQRLTLAGSPAGAVLALFSAASPTQPWPPAVQGREIAEAVAKVWAGTPPSGT